MRWKVVYRAEVLVDGPETVDHALEAARGTVIVSNGTLVALAVEPLEAIDAVGRVMEATTRDGLLDPQQVHDIMQYRPEEHRWALDADQS